MEAVERLLESSIPLPGTNRKAGFDALAGLVPVAGDIASAALGLYIIWEARRLGLPRWKLARMAFNLGLDTAIGAIPVAGDVFDFLFRSNSRNLGIVRQHLDRHHPSSRVIDG